MDLKSFKVGQTAYIVSGDPKLQEDSDSVELAEVLVVGRKYVTVRRKGGRWEFKFEKLDSPEDAPYLREVASFGWSRLLFRTEQDVQDFQECVRLQAWLRQATLGTKIDTYSLEQLRAVKNILDGGTEK